MCVWCGVVWCGTLKTPVCTFKTSPCVPAPRPHVVTRAGVVPAHTGTFLNVHKEGVLNVHTGRGVCVGRGRRGGRGEEGRGGQRDTPTPTQTHCTPTTQNTQGVIASCATKTCHVGLSLYPREVHQRNSWILHIFSLRTDREQHVPDSCNQSLYLIKLFSFSSPEGHCEGNQPPDGSICLSPPKPKCNERFARQTLSMMFGQRSFGPSTMVSCFFL